MNQILITEDKSYYYKNILLKNKNIRRKYLFIFFISIIICIILLLYVFYSYILKLNEKKKTNTIKNKYNITTLYSSNNSYNTIKLSNNIEIIGLLEIPSINISYPILSSSSEELLKISVCKFSGPLPNRNGNLCIAGHNYKNSMMFSNLNNVNINDSIYITDLNNVKLEYIVYKKYKVKENDLDCIKNTTDVQITLITCNNRNNKERIVIKAKVKE